MIVTYRCNAHCNMCDCFKDPTRPEEEITLDDIRLLPEMAFTNICLLYTSLLASSRMDLLLSFVKGITTACLSTPRRLTW